VVQEYRVVKDNRSKQKEASGTVSEVSNNRDSNNKHAISNIGDKKRYPLFFVPFFM
jgi:hypothetical protein